MSYGKNNKNKKQSTQQCQVHYRELFNKLFKFFNLGLILIILLTFLLILFTNQLHNSQKYIESRQLPNHTQEHINHFFLQTQNQLYFISKSIAKIINVQYQNYQSYQKLYYQQKTQLTSVQKMLYLKKYNTTGEYHCIGNCTALQFYLVNLWAKRVSFHSIASIYVKYYDPISNTTNIIYTPKDKNMLSQTAIQKLLLFSPQQANKSLIKIQKGLYFKSIFKYETSFDSQYQIQIAIQTRKSQMQRLLRNDIELLSFYQYKIYDSFQWISQAASKSLPVFSYKADQSITTINYQDHYTQQDLIIFYFKMPKIIIYMQFIKYSLLLPILVLFILFFTMKNIIREALFKIFQNTQTLVSLYQYNIQEIFTGNQPKQTIILSDTTITEFYQELSQLPTSEYQPIFHKLKKKVPPKSFLFADTLKAIVQRYNDYARIIFKEKNKEIMNNKFFIHSSVNELSQIQSLRIKQAFNKARQLKMLKKFFKYGYLTLLLSPDEFDRMIEQDSSPLPEQFIKLAREINRTVSGTDVRRAFKLTPDILRQTQQELEIRIQINLLQKYMQILKDLDIHDFFAKQLKLESDLQNISEYIQNIKHVLNKHNKNIRTLGR